MKLPRAPERLLRRLTYSAPPPPLETRLNRYFHISTVCAPGTPSSRTAGPAPDPDIRGPYRCISCCTHIQAEAGRNALLCSMDLLAHLRRNGRIYHRDECAFCMIAAAGIATADGRPRPPATTIHGH